MTTEIPKEEFFIYVINACLNAKKKKNITEIFWCKCEILSNLTSGVVSQRITCSHTINNFYIILYQPLKLVR